MIGIYHNKDLDGICCGAILKYKYPDIKLIGMDYGNDIPENPNHEEIIICDLSFPMDNMRKIYEESNNQMIWIDHHKSAIDNFIKSNNLFYNISLQVGISACELTWKYFFPERVVPFVVEALGAYDIWDLNNSIYDWDNIILPFQYGMRLFCNSVDNFPYILFEINLCTYDIQSRKNIMKNIIQDGKLILKYQAQQNERACKSAFETEFEGLRAVCLNIGGGNSTMFDSINNLDLYDLMITFVFSGDHWTYTLFTSKDDIDCSEIAKKYGGGGHKGAAGFIIKNLILCKENGKDL